jgi:hypothetical protein
MSFFSNVSGVSIHGGNFYSATGDVNIEHHLQLAIQDSKSESQVLAGLGFPDGFHPAIGPQRNGRFVTSTDRFLPYGAFHLRFPSA